MSKVVKEFYQNHATGEITVEYSDDSIRDFNFSNVLSSEESQTGRLITEYGGKYPKVNLRTTPVRIATFGDSTANVGQCTIPDSHSVDVITAPFPASSVNSVGIISVEKFAVHLFYPQAHLVANCGVSGDTTSLMLARDSSAYSETRKSITDALDSKPDVIFFRGGSINDLVSATTSNYKTIAETTFANHKKLLQRMLVAGVPIIDTGVYGYGDGSSATANNPDGVRLALKHLNALIKEFVDTLRGSVWFIDPVGKVQDSNGKMLSGASYDGVHLNFAGQYILAREEAAILSNIFGDSLNFRYSGKNLISNYLMTSVGTQSYGEVATGFSCIASNTTRGNAKIEYIDNKPYQTCEFTITSTNGLGLIYLPFPATTSNISSGEVYGFEYDYFVEGLNGFVPLTNSLYGRVELYKSGAGRVINSALVTQHGAFPAGGIKGHQSFLPIRIQEPSANLTTSSAFYFGFGCSNSSGTFKIGVSSPRMVKLEQTITTS